MDKKEERQSELYMPSGLRLEKEYFRGYGKKELIPTIAAGLMFLIIDALMFMSGSRNVGIFFMLPICGVSAVAMMLTKGELNISPVDMIRMEMEYVKEQKYYPYIAKNEWKNIN